MNLYGYVGADPFGYNDPRGLASLESQHLNMATAGLGLVAVSHVLMAIQELDIKLPTIQQDERAPDTLPPPGPWGDCDKKDRKGKLAKSLRKTSKRLESVRFGCNNETPVFQRGINAGIAQYLIFINQTINNMCFRGGDAKHRGKIERFETARRTCLGI